MFDHFDYFLPKSITFNDEYPWYETKNGYEFEAFAVAVNNQEGYVVVKNPDSGRTEDMVNIVAEEFDSAVEGWLVLLERQKTLGKAMISRPTYEDWQDITHYDNHKPVWILKIKPHPKSRLLT